MNQIGNGLYIAGHHEDALIVREAELAMMRRMEGPGREYNMLIAQGNLAITYNRLLRFEEALRLRREVYSGLLNLHGHQHFDTLREANNLATSLVNLKRFEEAKSLLRKTMPVARRVLGEGNIVTLRMSRTHTKALSEDPAATLDDLREAVATLEDAEQTARRVLGGAHPLAVDILQALRGTRAMLAAREGDVEPLRAAVEAMAPGDA